MKSNLTVKIIHINVKSGYGELNWSWMITNDHTFGRENFPLGQALLGILSKEGSPSIIITIISLLIAPFILLLKAPSFLNIEDLDRLES